MCSIDIGYDIVQEESQDFDKQYELLLSEWKSGLITSGDIKKLRKMIVEGIQLKKIPMQSGLSNLIKLGD